MKRVFWVFFACSLISRLHADPAVTVAPSPDWRQASPEQRAQVEKTAQGLSLLDCSFFSRGGTATLQGFVITERDTIDAFEAFRRGTMAGWKKRGLSVTSEKRAAGAPIPGRLVLMDGTVGSTRIYAVLWTVYTPKSAYLLMFVSPDRLDVDSSMVQSYLARLKFADAVQLGSEPPLGQLQAAWEAGNRAGEILFGILLVGLPIAAVILFRTFKSEKKRPNQPPEPTTMSVTPPAAQEPRQP
jgi:hypothetical protein